MLGIKKRVSKETGRVDTRLATGRLTQLEWPGGSCFLEDLAQRWDHLIFGIEQYSNHRCDRLPFAVDTAYKALQSAWPEIMIPVALSPTDPLELEHEVH